MAATVEDTNSRVPDTRRVEAFYVPLCGAKCKMNMSILQVTECNVYELRWEMMTKVRREAVIGVKKKSVIRFSVLGGLSCRWSSSWAKLYL